MANYWLPKSELEPRRLFRVTWYRSGLDLLHTLFETLNRSPGVQNHKTCFGAGAPSEWNEINSLCAPMKANRRERMQDKKHHPAFPSRNSIKDIANRPIANS
jgi:hypothetical protein